MMGSKHSHAAASPPHGPTIPSKLCESLLFSWDLQQTNLYRLGHSPHVLYRSAAVLGYIVLQYIGIFAYYILVPYACEYRLAAINTRNLPYSWKMRDQGQLQHPLWQSRLYIHSLQPTHTRP